MKTGRFSVEVDGVELAGFRTIDLPRRYSEEAEYREDDTAKRTWGQSKYDDLEMERGLAPDDDSLLQWRKAVEAGKADSGRKEIAVKLLDEEGTVQLQWEFQDAWPISYDPPELDATADGEIATESLTVKFDKMLRTK